MKRRPSNSWWTTCHAERRDAERLRVGLWEPSGSRPAPRPPPTPPETAPPQHSDQPKHQTARCIDARRPLGAKKIGETIRWRPREEDLATTTAAPRLSGS